MHRLVLESIQRSLINFPHFGFSTLLIPHQKQVKGRCDLKWTDQGRKLSRWSLKHCPSPLAHPSGFHNVKTLQGENKRARFRRTEPRKPPRGGPGDEFSCVPRVNPLTALGLHLFLQLVWEIPRAVSLGPAGLAALPRRRPDFGTRPRHHEETGAGPRAAGGQAGAEAPRAQGRPREARGGATRLGEPTTATRPRTPSLARCGPPSLTLAGRPGSLRGRSAGDGVTDARPRRQLVRLVGRNSGLKATETRAGRTATFRLREPGRMSSDVSSVLTAARRQERARPLLCAPPRPRPLLRVGWGGSGSPSWGDLAGRRGGRREEGKWESWTSGDGKALHLYFSGKGDV